MIKLEAQEQSYLLTWNNMNGRKERGLFRRRKKQAEEAMKELISLNEVLNLFGDKSQVADEIDPSIKKGLYNPFQQLDSRTGEPLDSLFQDEERWKLLDEYTALYVFMVLNYASTLKINFDKPKQNEV